MTPQQVYLIPLLPLLGFVFAGLFGRRLGKTAVSVVCCGVMALAFALSAALFQAYPTGQLLDSVVLFDWISAGSLSVPMAFLVDPLSLVMLLVVTGVGTLIHIYSIGYMHADEGFHRFFAYLNLFVFFMLLLVLGDSLPIMFVGWEGVGLCSYLLIGYYYQRPAAAAAGLKAFLVNRVGDFGFLVAMLLAYGLFGTLSFTSLAEMGPDVLAGHGSAPLRLMLFGLFLAATGKSAQIPLYIWLPDAMEGPSPVSALIHAATMVTSGIYMMARLFAVFSLVPDVLFVVAVVAAVTTVVAATMGTTANDIKKVLAYSTVSQLGYMFVGLGVGAATAGLFHLVTHAFFKACLFLGAGAVMHAMHDETDMRKMGGLWRKIPITHATMLVATLAIVGFPFSSGFVSKDGILLAASLKAHTSTEFTLVFALGVLTVVLTSFYMFRLYFMTFHGTRRMEQKAYDHAHDATPTMAFALIVLAILSAVGGFLNWPAAFKGHETFAAFIEPALRMPHVPGVLPAAAGDHLSLAEELKFSSICFLAAAIGFGLALVGYIRRPELPGQLAASPVGQPIYSLFARKWYVDEVYDFVFVRGLIRLGRFLREWIDEILIDGLVNLVGLGTQLVGEVLRAFQSGYVRNYALFFVIGAVAILVWVVL